MPAWRWEIPPCAPEIRATRKSATGLRTWPPQMTPSSPNMRAGRSTGLRVNFHSPRRRRLCRPASSDRMPSAWRYHPIRTEEASMAQQQAATPQKEGPLAHVLPPLPYAHDALEPYIDKMTMEIHHGKHHAAYVTNLNKAVEGGEWASKSLEEILANVSKLPPAVRNNGGGHWNHSAFWQWMKPKGGGQPSGELAAAMNRDLGSFDK